MSAANTRRVTIEPAMSQQQNRRRRKNTNVANGDGTSMSNKVALLASPIRVKKADQCQQMAEQVPKTTRLQRFVREMKDEDTKKTYVDAVDAHVNKLLEQVKGKERKRKGKTSQASQIADSKESKKIDMTSPDSILCHTNLKHILNPQTFASLPLFYQYKLVKMLPTCDQSVTNQGWIKPSPSALTNEFFTKASKEWCERLKDGRLTLDYIQKRANESEKERSKLDPWKVKNFEPIWGQCLESRRDARSELDRIPRIMIPVASPVSSAGKSLSPSSCSGQADDEISPAKAPKPSTSRYRSEPTARPLRPILKNSRPARPKSKRLAQAKVIVESIEAESDAIVVTTTQPMDLGAIVSETSVSVEEDSPSKRVRLSDEIVLTIRTTTVSEPASVVSSLRSSSVKVANSTISAGPTLSVTAIPLSDPITTVVTPQDDLPTTRSGRSRTMPIAAKPAIDTALEKALQKKNLLVAKKRPIPQLITNSDGIDEQRSLLICKKAVAQSANNKLFYVTNHGRIHQVTPKENELENSTTVTTNGDYPAMAVTPLVPSSRSSPPEGLACRALAELPVSLPEGLEVTARTASTGVQEHLPKSSDYVHGQEVTLNQRNGQQASQANNILANILTSSLLKQSKNSNMSVETSFSAASGLTVVSLDQHIDHQHQLLQPVKQHQMMEMKDSNGLALSSSLPYRIPDGITITPTFATVNATQASNQVPVIQRTEGQTLSVSLPNSTQGQVWLIPATTTSMSLPTQQSVQCSPVGGHHQTASVITLPPQNSANSAHGIYQTIGGHHQQAVTPSTGIHQVQINYCRELTRLPSQITVIPLGPSHATAGQHVNHISGHLSTTNQLQVNSNCACDLKPLMICSKCGAFCHEDCFGISGLCVACLSRCNTYAAVQSIPVIAAGQVAQQPVMAGQVPAPGTAYFCPM